MTLNPAFIPVILCGGSGSRLRPLTRDDRPKQFLALNGPYSMLQQTLRRVLNTGDAPASNTITVTLAQYRQETARHLGYIDKAALTHLICEPVARNTAAAVAVAALHARHSFGPQSILWVVPSDHHIADEAALRKACISAQALAERGKIVTFGITPSRPDTGYGYIRLGFGIGTDGFEISAFNEKPDAVSAQHYLAAGDYLWNSGMFMFRAEAILNEYAQHAPELLEAVEKAMSQPSLYDQIPAIAFDRAILEKTMLGAVVPCDLGWSDLGSWESLQSVTGETQEALLRRHQG
jgi:mannose-1-phosphate guanylyltransferase/mannose-6-phosphate isomerase